MSEDEQRHDGKPGHFTTAEFAAEYGGTTEWDVAGRALEDTKQAQPVTVLSAPAPAPDNDPPGAAETTNEHEALQHALWGQTHRHERGKWKPLLEGGLPAPASGGARQALVVESLQVEARVFAGDFDAVLRNTSVNNTVTCFVSSTFTDTKYERDLLISDVYPFLSRLVYPQYTPLFFSPFSFSHIPSVLSPLCCVPPSVLCVPLYLGCRPRPPVYSQ
jgi:hypothetical protein